jgi:hypothetical protein
LPGLRLHERATRQPDAGPRLSPNSGNALILPGGGRRNGRFREQPLDFRRLAWSHPAIRSQLDKRRARIFAQSPGKAWVPRRARSIAMATAFAVQPARPVASRRVAPGVEMRKLSPMPRKNSRPHGARRRAFSLSQSEWLELTRGTEKPTFRDGRLAASVGTNRKTLVG